MFNKITKLLIPAYRNHTVTARAQSTSASMVWQMTSRRSMPWKGSCMSGEWKPCWQKPCWQICARGLHGYVGASARVAPLGKYSYFLGGTF